MGIGSLAVGIGAVRGTVDGGPVEGIPTVGVVPGVVVDVPPMVPTKMGWESCQPWG